MEMKLSLAERLKDERKNRKLTMEQVEKETGVSRAAISKYENTDEAPKDVSPYNLEKLARFYDVSLDYLMGMTEQRKSDHTPIEDLHLSSEALEVLKNGQFNHRLLSEIITNEHFLRLLVDMEVYVDGHVTGRIRAFNAQLQAARNEVARQFSPDENEIGMRTLEAGQIDQHKYIGDIISEDLLSIAHDIREAHKNDFGVTSDDDLAKQAEENAKQVLNSGGSMTDQAIHMICLQLGIDYEKIDTVDRIALKRVLKKSPQFKTAVNQRGKKS